MVGASPFQGCYKEGDGIRALSSASYCNDTGMNLEQCLSDCTRCNYWGMESGGECYCGNQLNTGSVNGTEIRATAGSRPGNALEFREQIECSFLEDVTDGRESRGIQYMV